MGQQQNTLYTVQHSIYDMSKFKTYHLNIGAFSVKL